MFKVFTMGVWMVRINVRQIGRLKRIAISKSNLKGESAYVRRVFSYEIF